jgi:AcrR family transcriptional regulator
MNSTRSYSMVVRSERASVTRRRILDAARTLFESRSEDFTLEKVASTAGTSVQTVLRAFGDKEGLLDEVIGSLRNREPLQAGPERSLDEAIHVLLDDYEEIGDRVIRMLAEEHRIPGFAAVADHGRRSHRAWVETSFASSLSGTRPAARRRLLLALLAATDVYVWKLLRRDFNLDRRATESTMRQLVRGVLLDASPNE